MRLSKKGQYAITAMMDLAINFNCEPVKLVDISSSQTISLSYLEQLFALLKNAGLVEGVRGPGGGYRLGKTPDQISIADIVLAIEGTATSAEADEHSNSEEGQNGIANNLWNEFSDQLLAYLKSISLADIVKAQIVVKSQFQLDETTRRISSMFPVSASMQVA